MAPAWQPVDTRSDIDACDFTADPAEVFAALAHLLYGDRPWWHDMAACRGKGVDAWYPGRGEPLDAALAVCATCPVSDNCRAEALAVPMSVDYGVWGGTSVRERKHLRRMSPVGDTSTDVDTAASTVVDNRPSCVDCGQPCTRTRCLSCHNAQALAAMAPPSAA